MILSMEYRIRKKTRPIFKIIGFIILVFLLTVFFIEPARNYLINLTTNNKDSDSNEEQIIGTVSGYNPRVEDIQQILKDIGLEPGLVDGVMGYKTRSAIKDFQRSKGLQHTGKIDSVTWLTLGRDKEALQSVAEIVSLSNLSSSEPIVVPPRQEEKEEKMGTQGVEDKSRNKIRDDNVTVKDYDRAKQIQIALKKAGFYKGKTDGKIGSQTIRAVREFQRSHSLKPDGIVGSKTWKALNMYLENGGGR